MVPLVNSQFLAAPFAGAAAGVPGAVHICMPTPILSILMPALAKRRLMRGKLEQSLRKQMTPETELLINEDNGEKSSGTKRNELIAKSTGRYFCFVDDDDAVSNDYVPSILNECRVGVDVITFQLKRLNAIQEFSITYHDRQKLPYGVVGMMANHLCAWRRDIGTLVAFPDTGYNDDCFWYKPLVYSGLVKVERIIHRILYIYQYNPNITANQTADKREQSLKMAGQGLECFKRGGEIFVACSDIATTREQSEIQVRDKNNRVLTLERNKLSPYYVLRVV